MTIPSTNVMPSASGIEADSAAAPARMRTWSISSVAYAEDDSASDANTARATFFERVWCSTSAVDFGRPTSTAFRRSDGRAIDPSTRYRSEHFTPNGGALAVNLAR
jgi:hypothetical protein